MFYKGYRGLLLKDYCAINFDLTSPKHNWAKYLDAQRLQKNFFHTIVLKFATLKCATSTCMQVILFRTSSESVIFIGVRESILLRGGKNLA